MQLTDEDWRLLHQAISTAIDHARYSEERGLTWGAGERVRNLQSLHDKVKQLRESCESES